MSARPLRRRMLAVASSLALVAPAAASAQTPPEHFFTINANALKADSPLRDLHLANIAASRITAVRADVLWNTVENTPPVADPGAPGGLRRTFDFSGYDPFVAALARRGLTWRPILANSPYWNRIDGGTFTSRPADPTLAAGVAAALLGRYGAGGSFWSANRSLPARPVRWIEAWNEPNFAPSNTGAYRYPPAEYARFLRAVAEGARTVDAGAEIVVGGLVPHLTTTSRGMSVLDFLTQVDAAEPTVAGMTQGVATHVYGTDAGAVYSILGGVRDQVVSTPFRYARIHLNEMGSSVRPADEELGEPARAAYLEEMAKRAAAASGTACRMGSIAPYTWTTPESDALDPEHWFGIAQPDGTLRPSASALARGIAAAVAGDAACGTLPAPVSPTPGKKPKR